MIRFAALDFETANESPLSACALGVAVYEDGRPPAAVPADPPAGAGEFRRVQTPGCTGSPPRDVAGRSGFAAVWAEAAALVGDRRWPRTTPRSTWA
jgi:hypothetical protein